MAWYNQRKLYFILILSVLLLSFVYAQESIPTSQPAAGGCAPNAADDRCAIYAIARENVEKHWRGCLATVPSSCPVIPSGASGLPPGIIAGQRVSVDMIVNAIILRLEAQNLPTNPPKDWKTVLAAKRSVMSGIMAAIGGPTYKGPTMIDFTGKKPRRTGGSEGVESQPTSQPSIDSRPTVHLTGLVFTRFIRFFGFSIPSVSAQAPAPPVPPLVITVLFNNPDGTTYRHSMFCWGYNVDWDTGNGHYVCHNHKNQGYYIYLLDSKDEKITGKRLPPYGGPNGPQEEIINVTGTLEVIISHDVR